MDFDKLYDMFCEYYKDDGSNDAIMKGRIEKAFLEYAQQQFKILNLADVSNHRGLLKAFIKWNNEHNGIAQPVSEKMADNYLNSL